MRQYKLTGWSKNLFDAGHDWWVERFDIQFPTNVYVSDMFGLDSNNLPIIEIPNVSDFSLYWFNWEPLESTPDRGVV